ncbi:DUF3769 domain-containing protein [Richelia intracellularis]|uniref:DUF3769 domain-containing protein n=1 Tax=Richelia intracellularis TaxID=1164990 RepID=UPI0005C7B5E5|nr:DUF3769 domain-containing protein [Richelia intracellularis]
MLNAFLPYLVPLVLGTSNGSQNLALNRYKIIGHHNQYSSTDTKNRNKNNCPLSLQVSDNIPINGVTNYKSLSTSSSTRKIFTPGIPSSIRLGKAENLRNHLCVDYSLVTTCGCFSKSKKMLPLEDTRIMESPPITVNLKNSLTTKNPIRINFNSMAEGRLGTINFKSRQPISRANQSKTSHTRKTTYNSLNNPQKGKSGNLSLPTRLFIEVTSDRQEYDEPRRIITAKGKVIVRFNGSILAADHLQVNLGDFIATGEGNVSLARGNQLLRADKFTYKFIQDRGKLQNGRGEIFIPTVGKDFSFLATDVTTGRIVEPISDRIRVRQPLKASSPGAINFNIGGVNNVSNLPKYKQGGTVNKIRFEAAWIDFYPHGWNARDVKLTNDPFSPPELELRAKKITLTRKSPLKNKIKTQGQKLVFDQGLSLPIPKSSQTIDYRERNVTPILVSFGFDEDERGGLFLERRFEILNKETSQWNITPQFFTQEAIKKTSSIASVFGLKSKLNIQFDQRSILEGYGSLTSFDSGEIQEKLRANIRLQRKFGNLQKPHKLSMGFNYRERIFNSNLGFQTIQSSIGSTVMSPVIHLGKGLNLSYQTGAQYVTADTDRQELLNTIRNNNLVSLINFQGSAALSGGLLLWQGKGLPPTAKEGLQYTRNPVVPFIRLYTGVTATANLYSNGHKQSTINGTIGLQGQFGYSSKLFSDYTGFNISFSQGINSGVSPFLFDRDIDKKVLGLGVTQQIYGPLRIGFETAINLNTGESSTTDYILEYSRRTYGVTIRYNPVLGLGAVNFRVSDFNWNGGTNPFAPSEVRPVIGGIKRSD